MGIEKLWITFEGDVDIYALTRDIDRSPHVSDEAPAVVPDVDLDFRGICVPVVTTED
jgi:hypothetical protein